jgi:hypothetical protein
LFCFCHVVISQLGPARRGRATGINCGRVKNWSICRLFTTLPKPNRLLFGVKWCFGNEECILYFAQNSSSYLQLSQALGKNQDSQDAIIVSYRPTSSPSSCTFSIFQSHASRCRIDKIRCGEALPRTNITIRNAMILPTLSVAHGAAYRGR